ncbi:MAG: hypothetical protein H7841_00320 [Magnetospirillum sp. WYHS-4]
MIVFQDFSFLRFLLVLPQVRRDGGFSVIDGFGLAEDPPDVEALVIRCRRWVPGIRIGVIDHWRYPDELYLARNEGPERIRSLGDRIGRSWLAGAFRRLYPDEGILIGFQKLMLEEMCRAVYFRRILTRLAEDEESPILAVPEQSDVFGLLKDIPGVATPRLLRGFLLLREIFRAGKTLAAFAGVLGLNIGRMRRLPPPRSVRYATFLQYANTGTVEDQSHSHQGRIKSQYNRWNSFFLEDGEEFRPESILYCYLFWRFKPDSEAKLDAFIRERGGEVTRVLELPPSPEWVFKGQLLRYGPAILPSLLAALAAGPFHWRLAMSAVRFLHYLNIWEIFHLHHRPAVTLGYDDLTVSHIARTIVGRRHGLVNAGTHHAMIGGPYLGPEIAFAHYDLHLHATHHQALDFSPYWDAVPALVAGPLRADLVYRSLQDKERRAAFDAAYQGRRTVLVAPPGTGKVTKRELVLAFYRTLARLAAERPDVVLVFRPRSSFWYTPECEAILQPAVDAGQLVMENERFDTYELVAYCDLIVATLSTMIEEALACERNIVCFDFYERAWLYRIFREEPDLVTADEDELLKRIYARLDLSEPAPQTLRARDRLGIVGDGGAVGRVRGALVALARGTAPKDLMGTKDGHD